MAGTERLRWGVLSTARIGRKAVAPAIVRSSNGTLLAIASRDAERAGEMAAELRQELEPAVGTDLGSLRTRGSYRALIDDPEIDALYVPLPNAQHAEWTIRAAEAGKHVLCEKPLAMTASECRAMHDAASAHGVVLMEAFMYRFHPRIERLIAAVRAGDLGQLHFVQASFTFTVTDPANIRLNLELGGGALMDVGCYAVNAARTLMGGEPGEVQARARWSKSGVDEQLLGTLRFEGGGVAQIACSLAAARSEDLLVVGEKGVARLRHAFVPTGQTVALEFQRPPSPPEVIAFEPVDSYQRMVEHFGACALQGVAPRYDALEAAANLAAIEALYASARGGGVAVDVPPA
ncbi:MAG: Gfo/Idh/MocA family oxidoreductase [Trueperaceae bacterium]